MASTKPTQTRSIDPFSSFDGKDINKAIRAISKNEKGLLSPNALQVKIHDSEPDYKVIVSTGFAIIDDVLIEITGEHIVDFTDSEHYYITDENLPKNGGYYYIVLDYKYTKTKPPQEAEIKILKPEESQILSTSPNLIILKIVSISSASPYNILTLHDYDPTIPNNVRKYIKHYASPEVKLPTFDKNKDQGRFVYEFERDDYFLGYADGWNIEEETAPTSQAIGSVITNVFIDDLTVTKGTLCYVNNLGKAVPAIATNIKTCADLCILFLGSSITPGRGLSAGYIEDVKVQPGISVQKGHILYLSADVEGTVTNIRTSELYQVVGRALTDGNELTSIKIIFSPKIPISLSIEGTIDSWTTSVIGQETINFSRSVSSITTTSSGFDGRFSFFVQRDGTLWSMGTGIHSVLGQGNDVTDKSSPVQIGTDTDWLSVTSGRYRGMALKKNGDLYTWGRNMYYELGRGGWTWDSGTPGKTWNSVHDFNMVSPGLGQHNIAIKNNGTLWGWGFSQYGALAGGSINISYGIPTQISSLTSWKQCSAGFGNTLVIRTDGSLWGTGHNAYYELGLGDRYYRLNFTRVGNDVGWTHISASYETSAGIRNGRIFAWGFNGSSCLGISGSLATYVTIPQNRISDRTDWKKVEATKGLIVALNNDGSLWYTGTITSGSSGSSSPVQIGTNFDWADFSITKTTIEIACIIAIKTDNTAWVFGNNSFGQLGLGDITNRTEFINLAIEELVDIEEHTTEIDISRLKGKSAFLTSWYDDDTNKKIKPKSVEIIDNGETLRVKSDELQDINYMISVGGGTDVGSTPTYIINHADFANITYQNSGHTGFTPSPHNNTHHSDNYITIDLVNFMTLYNNDAVGNLFNQVSFGNHSHSNLIDVPVGSIVLTESNIAVTGYSLLTDLDDMTIFITKGSANEGETGGTLKSGGTWSQPVHYHNIQQDSSHIHTTSGYTLQVTDIPPHTHGGVPLYVPGGNTDRGTQSSLFNLTSVSSATASGSNNSHTHGTVASSGEHDHGGVTNSTSATTSWKPSGINFTRQRRL